ncbi:mce family protein [Mycobacteroides abscessus subsp. massiliense]|uniref:MlaD family protein n=1 Tax=Mycobacteroides abscessus TaxID=36809 RepID=UPI0009A90992|nr:MlaD family protein [Mycobacteroides abscessus]SKR01517.1 mce family protein [Mycobacteroides abscessus subsp. massiliense]SKR64232.1 mce family protein [Mycobacteroides abscessus subsp. massiliense]SKT48010.1 mce family protein [Mycobacteroides abscessus subsp. massiliense]SKT85581.1 mce family protein [Mycobacteroides abscessus subsp. massiliense]SLA27861.1 mce family protein [Mycobacteroides abscessus subsp. massiliense]
MSALTARIGSLFAGQDRRHKTVGVLVCLLIAAVAAALGANHLWQLGHRTVTFTIDDGAAIKPGDEVKVAGWPVGKVDSVRLIDDIVTVQASVDNDIYLGDRTSVEIRMVTAAGGYYVDLISAGDKALGNNVIPSSRTRPPYRLPELLSTGTEKVKDIDVSQLGPSLDRLSTMMDANPNGIATMVDAIRKVSDLVTHQKGQMQTMLDVGQELTHTATKNQEHMIEVLHKAAILITVVDNVKVQLQQALPPLLKSVKTVMGVANFYDSHRDWLLDILQRTTNALNVINTDFPRMIWNLGNFVNDIRAMISPKGPQPIEDHLLASDFCVPMPGRSC